MIPRSAVSPIEEAASLRVGAASISITPVGPTGLQGYGVRLAEGVDEPLVASALAIGAKQIDWLLISLDLIGVDRTFTARIRDTLAKSLSVPRDSVTLACSHTHSAPPSLRHLGPVTFDHAYMELLEARLIEVARTAAACRRPAELRIGEAQVPENINRRERKNGRIELGTNPAGPVDHRVWVGRFDALTGSTTDAPMALIVHYACHATCSSDDSRVSSDWPGAMRDTLQRVYERGGVQPVICFIQGCAGDVTHGIGRDPRRWPKHFGASTSLEASIMGRLVAAGAIAAVERAAPAPSVRVVANSTQVALPFRDLPCFEQTEVQVVRVSASSAGKASNAASTTWVLLLPGEPLAAYGEVLRRAFGARFGASSSNVVVCGYANDAVGYLCTPQALREGGYEAADAHRVYHRPSPFASETLSVIRRACIGAAEHLDGPQRRWRWLLSVTVWPLIESIRSVLMRRYSGMPTSPLS